MTKKRAMHDSSVSLGADERARVSEVAKLSHDLSVLRGPAGNHQ